MQGHIDALPPSCPDTKAGAPIPERLCAQGELKVIGGPQR
ncbi:hypothetical protein DB31_8904 [Hyalangium minutum]|uniref:Uncharacterized protein n=1 Tax=Hyalangium minutum TaxID=394096 RepID=A0A085WG77_9BACT|nr:hypothetical protein DB31_8904 [Hyalangium minutum]